MSTVTIGVSGEAEVKRRLAAGRLVGHDVKTIHGGGRRFNPCRTHQGFPEESGAFGRWRRQP